MKPTTHNQYREIIGKEKARFAIETAGEKTYSEFSELFLGHTIRFEIGSMAWV